MRGMGGEVKGGRRGKRETHVLAQTKAIGLHRLRLRGGARWWMGGKKETRTTGASEMCKMLWCVTLSETRGGFWLKMF